VSSWLRQKLHPTCLMSQPTLSPLRCGRGDGFVVPAFCHELSCHPEAEVRGAQRRHLQAKPSQCSPQPDILTFPLHSLRRLRSLLYCPPHLCPLTLSDPAGQRVPPGMCPSTAYWKWNSSSLFVGSSQTLGSGSAEPLSFVALSQR
jgi:hypothetical protein